MIKGTFFKDFSGRKIIKIEVNGEFFIVHFNDGERLTVNLNELNYIVASATGR